MFTETDIALKVAPFVGAWIEILIVNYLRIAIDVAPFVGAWIEISMSNPINHIAFSRSVRRSVD